MARCLIKHQEQLCIYFESFTKSKRHSVDGTRLETSDLNHVTYGRDISLKVIYREMRIDLRILIVKFEEKYFYS